MLVFITGAVENARKPRGSIRDVQNQGKFLRVIWRIRAEISRVAHAPLPWGGRGVPLFASLQLVAKCRCRRQCHRNPNPRPLSLLSLGSLLPPSSSPGVVVYFHSAPSPVLCLLPLSPWSSSRSTASSAEIEPRLRGAREQGLCSRLIFQPVHWLPWTSTCALCLRTRGTIVVVLVTSKTDARNPQRW